MDDARCRQFFENANSSTYHRQYEALRAVFLEGHSQKAVADQFGFRYGSLRQLVYGFRRALDDSRPAPFFESPR